MKKYRNREEAARVARGSLKKKIWKDNHKNDWFPTSAKTPDSVVQAEKEDHKKEIDEALAAFDDVEKVPEYISGVCRPRHKRFIPTKQ